MMNIQDLNFKIADRVLVISNSQEIKNIKFQFRLKQVEEFDNVFVVRLDVPRGTVFNENIFGVSAQGEILWQIEKLKYAYKDSPFTGMSREGGNLKLFNWDGTDLIVNPETGGIIRRDYSK